MNISAKHKSALAGNLRQLIAGYGSVVDFCRATGINRSQFHRYLNGESLPRPQLLSVIAREFGVRESELLKNEYNCEIKSIRQESEIYYDINEILENISNRKINSIHEGMYITYIYVDGDEGMVMRGLTIISLKNNIPVFIRLSGVREPRGSRWRFSRGRNAGAIIEERGVLYFVGINRGRPNVPSILTMQHVHTGRPLLVGQGLVVSRNGPAFAAIAMERLAESTKLASAVRHCSTISIRDHAIPGDIRLALMERMPA